MRTLGACGEGEIRGMGVDCIGNHPNRHAFVEQRCSDRTGRAAIELAHGIEEMGCHTRARIDTGFELLEGRLGMPETDQHATFH